MSGNKRNLSRKRRRKRNKKNNMCSAPRPFRHEKQEDEPSGHPPSPDQSDEEDVEISMVNYAIRLSQLSYQSHKQKGVIVSNPLKPIPRWKPESTYELGESSTASQSCSTCKDAHPTGIAMPKINECGHIYCLGCVPDFLGGQIKNLTNITQVKCAESHCKTTFPYDHCGSYLPEEVMERWKAAKAESSVLWYPWKLYCPFEECGEVIVDDERGFKIKACPYCWRVFCVSCRVKWHLGKSCRAFQEELELERKRQEELELEKKRQEEMELERERKERVAKIGRVIEKLNQINEEIQKMEEAEAIDEFNSRRFGSNLRRRSMWDKDYDEEQQRAQRMEELQQKRQRILEVLGQEHNRRLLLEDGNSGDEGRILLFRFL